ncbi:unnamed protein product [Porites evermanni]|uniref:E3 ubiquitin-protein ligase n=1 Tax=Porites evermanni TaxID=104178 RepID=A0ABN8M3Y3_9CNID|nr:unnamed protein product [Porites evermanni]
MIFITRPTDLGVLMGKELGQFFVYNCFSSDRPTLESMAQSKSFFDDVKKELECPVCQEQFSQIHEPKIMKCLHTFCKTCLEAWLRQHREEQLSCPTCRQITECPNSNINSLPSNLFYKQMVEIVEAYSGQGKEDSPQCGLCDEKKALKFYCFECNSFLCDDCVGVHKKGKIFSGHHVKDIGNFQSCDVQDYARRANYCTVHIDEMRFYCENCKRCICRDCAILEHQDHNKIALDQGLENIKSEIDIKVHEAQENGCRLRSYKVSLEKRRMKVNGSIEEATKEVKRVAELCILSIRQHEASVTEQLIKQKQAFKNAFDNQMTMLDGKLMEIESTLAFSEEILLRNNLPEILNVKAVLEEKLREVSDPLQPLEAMPKLGYSEVKYVQNDIFLKDAPGKLVANATEPLLSVAEGKDDITKQRVDVIVNAANRELQHDAGVATAILAKGGRTINEESQAIIRIRGFLKDGEVVVTNSGKLPCKAIVHAVGPRCNDVGGKKSKKILRQACLNSFIETEKLNMTSIALPAIGSGINGVPKDVCAEVMFNAVDEYARRGDAKKKKISDIRFVNIDDSSVQAFSEELKKRYGVYPERYSLEKETGGDTSGRSPSSAGAEGGRSAVPPSRSSREVCPICLDKKSRPRSLKCKHSFCSECIQATLNVCNKCPVCQQPQGVMVGNQPRGQMTFSIDRYSVPGYEGYGTIVINYYLPSGLQGPEHPNPGRHYDGTSRTAYLPDNREGQQVLQLLRRAFDARLVFTVGTSSTSGLTNQVIWNDIHHKTNRSGGLYGFGYPDPDYLRRVKEELAAKGIQ